jgi:hypothetical protein
MIYVAVNVPVCLASNCGVNSEWVERLCGLVVRISGYISIGPGSIPGANQIFKELVGLEQGPLSLVSTIEELL